MKSLVCALYFKCFSKFKKIAHLSLDLFLKVWEIEVVPDIKRVNREKISERQSGSCERHLGEEVLQCGEVHLIFSRNERVFVT